MRGIHLFLASGFSWWTAALLAVVAIAAVAFSYSITTRRRAGARRWLLPLIFRALGVVALLLLLLKPELDIEKNRRERHTLLLLLDKSASMSLKDDSSGGDRLNLSRLLARDCEKILEDSDSANFSIIPFDENPCHPVSGEDILQLEASGDASDLSASFRAASGISPPVSRVILVTDGNDTTGVDPLLAATPLGVPVDTVAIGQDLREGKDYRDVFLEDPERRDRVPVGSVTQVVAHVGATGFAGQTAHLTLRCGDELLAKSEVILDSLRGSQAVPLNFHPRQTGVFDLTLTVQPLSGESVAENNTVSFPLSVHEKLPRVVYVEGRIRPDYRYLRRALATDPGIEFMSLIRMRGDLWNRQGSISGLELDGLPENLAQFKAFDVLMLGELSAAELGQCAHLIRQAVAEGMGLLILPSPVTTGARSEYENSPLFPLFPLVPLRKIMEEEAAVDLPKADHPLSENLKTFFATGSLSLPGIDLMQPPRPGALVILQARRGKETYPLLAVYPFGQGRTALFCGHDSWQWSLDGSACYSQLFGQTVRWLAGEDKQKNSESVDFSVTADKLVASAGEELRFSASTGKRAGEKCSVSAEVTRGEQSFDRFGFAEVPGMEGTFEGRFSTTRPGKYTVKVSALAGKTEFASRELNIRIRGGKGEFERLSPDRRLLARIARETGGEVVEPELLTEKISRLVAEDNRVREIYHLRLWHEGGLFLALALFLSLEWFLRKRAGLP